MSEYFSCTSNPVYSSFIHLSRYARWLPEEGRRETWPETVDRYISFFSARFPELAEEISSLREPILNLEVMPSMRALMTAGKALDKTELAAYNCAFVAVDHPRVFDEMMYVLMAGTGVGFSVERQFVNKLPEVAEEFHETDTTIIVRDSKIGWAAAFRELISLLYMGQIPKWDMSRVRPAGARLKTFGGRASGPGPLEDLFKFSVQLFKRSAGRKLSSIECHDLCCKIGDVVVVGGVRRSALLSLSNVSDDRMRLAKSGQWWVDTPHRRLANNSACYTERPDFEVFLKEWMSLYESKSGERGIFSRVAARKQAAKSGRRDPDLVVGTNPCSEILLRSPGLCNLTEIVVRSSDNVKVLERKVRLATILGTLQASLTNFKYLRNVWKKNAEEERLLGVSLTGIMDHPLLADADNTDLPDILIHLKNVAIETNKEWASKLGIEPSASITCVKPSGTVSQLVDSASGIHARFAPYYLRRVRADKKDPLAQMMEAMGFPCEEDVMNPSALVFSFPVKAPVDAVFTKDLSAIDQLKLWKIYQDYWCEHKPSITVYYTDDEFLQLGQWVWENFDDISGISFLPRLDHVYKQAPYEAVSESIYLEWCAKMPKVVDWSLLSSYEKEDNTVGSQAYACSAGVCEVVDLVER